MALGLDAEIARIAGGQHGNVTRSQLLALGMGNDAIEYRLRIGRLHRVYVGVYSVGQPPRSRIDLAAGAVLACGSRAVLSHGSALSLWGWKKTWELPIEITAPVLMRRAGIRSHRSTALTRRYDIRIQFGIWVTSPARTLLDVAPRLHEKVLARAVNAARVSHHVSLPDLGELLARFPRHPGASLLRPFVDSPRGPTRSDLEDAFVAFTDRFRLPMPQINVKVAGYEVDAVFMAEKVIVELDSYEFHADRAAFEQDRDRDADTTAAGFVTVRMTWRRLIGKSPAEADRLNTILRIRRAA